MAHELSSWPELVRHGGIAFEGQARGDVAGARGASQRGRLCAPRDRLVASRTRRPVGSERSRRGGTASLVRYLDVLDTTLGAVPEIGYGCFAIVGQQYAVVLEHGIRCLTTRNRGGLSDRTSAS